jgi:hypothetical protein
MFNIRLHTLSWFILTHAGAICRFDSPFYFLKMKKENVTRVFVSCFVVSDTMQSCM